MSHQQQLLLFHVLLDMNKTIKKEFIFSSYLDLAMNEFYQYHLEYHVLIPRLLEQQLSDILMLDFLVVVREHLA